MSPVHGDLVQAIIKRNINNRTMFNTTHCFIPDFDFRDLKKVQYWTMKQLYYSHFSSNEIESPEKNDFLFINSQFYLDQIFY